MQFQFLHDQVKPPHNGCYKSFKVKNLSDQSTIEEDRNDGP